MGELVVVQRVPVAGALIIVRFVQRMLRRRSRGAPRSQSTVKRRAIPVAQGAELFAQAPEHDDA